MGLKTHLFLFLYMLSKPINTINIISIFYDKERNDSMAKE